jgi:hypothetical protein
VNIRSFVFLIAMATLCGCGGSEGPALSPVSGTVLYKNKPITGATVTMISEKGMISNGFTDNDGKFRMTTGGRPGVPVGNAKVGIAKMSGSTTIDVKALKPEDMRKMQSEGGGVAKDLTPKSEIPVKYADPAKSKLVAAVNPDGKKNVFEYILVE